MVVVGCRVSSTNTKCPGMPEHSHGRNLPALSATEFSFTSGAPAGRGPGPATAVMAVVGAVMR